MLAGAVSVVAGRLLERSSPFGLRRRRDGLRLRISHFHPLPVPPDRARRRRPARRRLRSFFPEFPAERANGRSAGFRPGLRHGRDRTGGGDGSGFAPPHADRAPADRQAGRLAENSAGRSDLRRPRQPRPVGLPAGPDHRPRQRPGARHRFHHRRSGQRRHAGARASPHVRSSEAASIPPGSLRLHGKSRVLRRPGEDLRGHPGRRRAASSRTRPSSSRIHSM